MPDGERAPLRVLIVAAYASARAGLHALLADEGDCEVVGEVRGSAELERFLPSVAPVVVLFDASEGEEQRVLDAVVGSDAGLVVLGDDREGFRTLAAAALRGWGYLLKEAEGPEIAAAVRAAGAGLVSLDRSLAPLLATPSSVGRRDAGGLGAALTPDAWRPPPVDVEPLTVREREVLQQMAGGLPNKLIAARLGISQHTVKFHVASILAKLGAASRTEAVALGARLGYLIL